MLDILSGSVPFVLGALTGVIASYVTNYLILRADSRRDRATMVLAELANAIRHFERSVQNLESFSKDTRLGRISDYQKCKYSDSGFVGISYADLIGLPDKLSRDVMQMGLVFRNQNIEVDYVISTLKQTSENEGERSKKFAAVEKLVKRMEMLIQMSKELETNIREYSNNNGALRFNREINWSDEFYESGRRYKD